VSRSAANRPASAAPGLPGARAWLRRLGLVQPRLLLRVRGQVLQVEYDCAGTLEPLGQWPWPIEPAQLEARLGARLACLPWHWVLSADAVVRRSLELPAAAAARLDELARFEVERQTPFSAERALYQARVLQRGAAAAPLRAELVVAPRRCWEALDPAWQQALAGVEVEDGAGGVLGVNLLPHALRRRRRDPLRPWPWVLAALAMVLAVAAAMQWLGNRRHALEDLRRQVEAAAPQAREESARIQRLRAQLEGVAFLDRRRAARPTALELWGQVSQRLPQGTYLDRFSLQGERLQLAGLGPDAASLVAALEDCPGLREPALDSVQRDAQGGRLDRFVLSARVAAGESP